VDLHCIVFEILRIATCLAVESADPRAGTMRQKRFFVNSASFPQPGGTAMPFTDHLGQPLFSC
jgi:hypothetical protein